MKNTYIVPETLIVNVNAQSMISSSPQFGIDNNNEHVVNGGNALTRENNAWDIWDEGDDLEE